MFQVWVNECFIKKIISKFKARQSMTKSQEKTSGVETDNFSLKNLVQVSVQFVLKPATTGWNSTPQKERKFLPHDHVSRKSWAGIPQTHPFPPIWKRICFGLSLNLDSSIHLYNSGGKPNPNLQIKF